MAGGEILLHFPRAVGHARQILVAHLADGLVYFLIVDPRGLQRSSSGLGREHFANRSFVRLTRGSSLLQVIAQLAGSNGVIRLLSGDWHRTQREQAGSK